MSLEIHEAKPTKKCFKIETNGQILLDNKKSVAELIFSLLHLLFLATFGFEREMEEMVVGVCVGFHCIISFGLSAT